MIDSQKQKMPWAYTFLWICITVAYGAWMTFYMKDIILIHYEKEAARSISGYAPYFIHPDITGMIGRHWLYPVWVVVSCVCMLLFIVYISKILYTEFLGKGVTVICLIMLLVGCVFINLYGFFDVTIVKDTVVTQATFKDKLTYITASMTGLQYPWSFRLWGILAGAGVFMNTMYVYRKYNYNNRLGVILGSLGSAAIFITVNCPSYGVEKDFSVMRCVGHWAGAIVFAGCCAMPLIFFLFSKAVKEKGRFLIALISFGLVLVVLVILTVLGFKSAVIENIPMTAAYILMFLLNFTGLFDRKQTVE